MKNKYFIIILFGFLQLLPGTGLSQEKAAGNNSSLQKTPVVYPRQRLWPSPSGGLGAKFNPPVLLWPSKEKMIWSIRLSEDPEFKNGSTLLAENLKWAMFNPHKKLASGNWHWQYKSEKGSWSKTASFVINEKTPELVSPEAKIFTGKIAAGHPRILVQKEEMNQLKSLVNSPDAKAILAEAGKYLRNDILKESDGYSIRKADNENQQRKLDQDASQKLSNDVFEKITALTEAFLLTGNDAYSAKAISTAMEMSTWNPEGVTKLSDFGDARCMVAMAIVFDTFYDQLNPVQKSKLVQAISQRAGDFYNNWVNNIEAKVLSGHVWQHILDYFFQTSLALYGEKPEASEWLNYAYELFLARAPVLGGPDGGWVEGVYYFRMNMATMLDIPLFIKKLTGFDYINAHPWYRENVKWMVYHIPPGSTADGFSDNTEEVLKPGPEYIAYAEEIAKLTGNTLAAWYARECRKYENPDLSQTESLRWTRLTRTGNLNMPAAIEQADLPMGAVFREMGLAALHTNPTNTATDLMVTFKSSPLGAYGHNLCDQNVFNILYGGQPLFFRTGYKVAMDDPHRTGWYQTTKSQNGILVNGEGQPYSSEAFGVITRFMQGNEIAYLKGDAGNAYPYKKNDPEVKKFFRHIVLLKPDIVIIYDELESAREASWSWLIHSLKPLKINELNQTFSATIPNATGLGKLFSSRPVKWELADTADIRANNWLGSKYADGSLKTYDNPQWHLKVTSQEKCNKMRFLVVLQISPDTGLIEKIANKPGENGKMDISIGPWNISVSLNSNQPADLSIRKTDEKAAFSLHSKEIVLNGEKYSGKTDNSSKLLEMIQGKMVFSESGDVLPWNVQEAIRNLNQQN
jgi:hypothetical protein